MKNCSHCIWRTWSNITIHLTNNEELFALLMEDVVKHNYPFNKQVFVTSGPIVKSNHADKSMEESYHEEADIIICLHVHNNLKEGATTVLSSEP